MRRMPFVLLLVGLILVQRHTLVGQSNFVSNSDPEAAAQAKAFWAAHLSSCGNSYVARSLGPPFWPAAAMLSWEAGRRNADEELIEVMSPVFWMGARQLNTADKLNGIEWDGEFYVSGAVRKLEVGLANLLKSPQKVSNWEDKSGEQDPRTGRRTSWVWARKARKLHGAWLSWFSLSALHNEWKPMEDVSDLIKASCDVFLGGSASSPTSETAPASTDAVAAPGPSSSGARYPISSGIGTTTRFVVLNDTYKPIQVFLDDSDTPIELKVQRVYDKQLEIGSTHLLKAIVGQETFEVRFTVPRVMRRVTVSARGIQVP